jgi:hypothetical protein
MATRLIIVGPGKGDIGDFSMAWGRLLEVLQSYVKGRGSYDMYRDFLSTGLPYHLPFSFDPDTARAFASDLIRVGCEVAIVPAGD